MEKYVLKLKEVMQSKGITHIRLAEMLGIKNQNISRWTTGKICPTIDTLVKLCRCLDCSPNDLIEIIE